MFNSNLQLSLLAYGGVCPINIDPELIRIEDGQILVSLLGSYVNLNFRL